MNEKIYDWRELDLQSLDLILCAGKSKMSRRIQKFQRLTGAPKEFAKFSHVAGIVSKPCGVRARPGYMAVQESTTLNSFSGQRGVQMNMMDRWLPNYDGEVYIKKLEFKRTDDFYLYDIDFWEQHKDDDYESGIPGTIELLLCGLRLHRYVRRFFPDYTPKFTDEPHCTELKAMRLQAHGHLNKEAAINRLPPWVWGEKINGYIKCPTSKLIKIKGI